MLAARLPMVHHGTNPKPLKCMEAQVRGSIPLYWGQDVASMSPMNPKPAIQLQQNDPHFLATRLHFQARASSCHAPCLNGQLPHQRDFSSQALAWASLYAGLHCLDQRPPAVLPAGLPCC